MWKPVVMVTAGVLIGVAIATAAPQSLTSSALQWGLTPSMDAEFYKMPVLVFLTQRKCDQCGNHLPKQCVIYGSAQNDVTCQAVTTVLDYTSKPNWVVVDGHRVPDPQWVNEDKSPGVKAFFARTNWPRGWSLEDWLGKQRTAEAERLKNLGKTAAEASEEPGAGSDGAGDSDSAAAQDS